MTNLVKEQGDRGEILGTESGQVPGVLCEKTIPGEMQHTCPDTDSTTDWSMKNTTVQRGEPISFIGITYRNMADRIQEQKWHKDSCINSPPQHGWQLKKSGNLEHISQPEGNWRVWRMSLPSDRSKPLLGSLVASVSSRQLVWSQSLLSSSDSFSLRDSQYLLFSRGREGPSEIW